MRNLSGLKMGGKITRGFPRIGRTSQRGSEIFLMTNKERQKLIIITMRNISDLKMEENFTRGFTRIERTSQRDPKNFKGQTKTEKLLIRSNVSDLKIG